MERRILREVAVPPGQATGRHFHDGTLLGFKGSSSPPRSPSAPRRAACQRRLPGRGAPRESDAAALRARAFAGRASPVRGAASGSAAVTFPAAVRSMRVVACAPPHRPPQRGREHVWPRDPGTTDASARRLLMLSPAGRGRPQAIRISRSEPSPKAVPGGERPSRTVLLCPVAPTPVSYDSRLEPQKDA